MILRVAEDLHQAIYVDGDNIPQLEDDYLAPDNLDPTLDLHD